MAGRKRAELISGPLAEAAYGKGTNGLVMMDLAAGGFSGYIPDLVNWTSNQLRLPKAVIPIVLEIPRLFEYLPGKERWIASVIAMMEQHSSSITGLQDGYEISTDESEIGGTGEFYEDVTDIKGARTSLSYAFKELRGEPFKRLTAAWLRYGVMDHRTKFPLLANVVKDANTRRLLTMTPEFNTMSMMFIEPDVSGMKVEKTWIASNIKPKTIPTYEGSRTLSEGQGFQEATVEFTSFTEISESTKAVGDEVFEYIMSTAIDPQNRQAHITEINSIVKARTNVGFKATASKL